MILSAKDYQETLPLRFDFTDALAGESIAALPTLTVEAEQQGDTTPNNLLQGSFVYTTKTVTQVITGGVVGVTYHLRCTVLTNGSPPRTLVASAEIPVIKR